MHLENSQNLILDMARNSKGSNFVQVFKKKGLRYYSSVNWTPVNGLYAVFKTSSRNKPFFMLFPGPITEKYMLKFFSY